ncbi:hypothetical protein BTA31_17765 [Bacillus haynesii]|uniref:Uncharacterized protein n=1 Tax=Bacillus haynesii TaxID=1925021 RepID=A0ABX3I1W5_9BACI|nr:hypothetical protein [Bacillus haynesii]OMI25666.1 hypothetical protein BTA31_17765 [Bacillus haynesii]
MLAKKLLFLGMPLVLTLGFTFSNTTNAVSKDSKEDYSSQTVEEQKQAYKEKMTNLSQEEIVSNFERIDREYNIGEEFSLKDQAFVEMYASPANPEDVNILATKYISGSKTSNGVTVKVSGNIKDDIQNLINQSFGASNLKTSTTAGASKVTSVKTEVFHNAYGLVGSGGVGKVYSGSISTSGKNTTLSATKRYSAVVVYASTWCTVTVNHKGGTFTVNPN